MTTSPGSDEVKFQRLDASRIALLRCPACKGSLAIEDTRSPQSITCRECARSYPVVEGLPVLIAERASL